MDSSGGGHGASIDHAIRLQSDLFARGRKYATLTYLEGVTNAKQRKRYTEWERSVQDMFRMYLVGAAVVVNSRLVLGGMTALRWLSPAPYPELVTLNPVQALEFVVRALERAEVDLGDGAKAYLSELRKAKDVTAA